MDPLTGKIYDLSDPTIPDHVRDRLIPIDQDRETDLEAELNALKEDKIRGETEVRSS